MSKPKEDIVTRINNIDLDHPTKDDMQFIINWIDNLPAGMLKLRLQAAKSYADGGKSLAKQVHEIVNGDGISQTVKPVKREVELKPKKVNASDVLKTKRLIRRLVVPTSSKKVAENNKEIVDEIKKKQEEEKEQEKAKVETIYTKPMVIVGESEKESTQPVQEIPDSVHKFETVPEKVEPTSAPNVEPPRDKVNNQIIEFGASAGREIMAQIPDFINQNGRIPTREEFINVISNTVMNKLGNDFYKVPTEMRYLLGNTTVDYIRPFLDYQVSVLRDVNNLREIEMRRQDTIIGSMINTIQTTAANYNMQLTEFMNKGAMMIQNLWQQNRKDLQDFEQRAYELLKEERERQDNNLLLMNENSNKIIDKIREDNASQMNVITAQVDKLIAENAEKEKRIEAISDKYLGAFKDITEQLINLIQTNTKVEKENGIEKHRKEKDENVVTENFASDIMNKFTEFAQHTTERVFNQSDKFGDKLIDNERQTQDNVFSAMHHTMKSAQPNTQLAHVEVDPDSHSVNKVSKSDGLSLQEALAYFTQAQEMAMKLSNQDRVTVKDFKELVDKLDVKFSPEVKEQIGDKIDIDNFGKITEMIKHYAGIVEDDNSVTSNFIKQMLEDNIEDLKDELASLKKILLKEKTRDSHSEGNTQNVDDTSVDTVDVLQTQPEEEEFEPLTLNDDIMDLTDDKVAAYIYNKSKNLSQVFDTLEAIRRFRPGLANILLSMLRDFNEELVDAFERKAKKRGVILVDVLPPINRPRITGKLLN